MLTALSSQAKTIKVLEIDTGVSIDSPEIRQHVNMGNWNKEDYIDTNSHGTHIAGIILKDTCKEVELISCKYYHTYTPANVQDSTNCFKLALKEHFDFINYSSVGYESNEEEYNVIKQISDKGTIILVAAGNDNADLSKPKNKSYPAKYKVKNLIPVGNLDLHNKRAPTSNYGLKNMVWEVGTSVYSTLPHNSYGYMTGTSQATATHTNRLLKQRCLKIK